MSIHKDPSKYLVEYKEEEGQANTTSTGPQYAWPVDKLPKAVRGIPDALGEPISKHYYSKLRAISNSSNANPFRRSLHVWMVKSSNQWGWGRRTLSIGDLAVDLQVLQPVLDQVIKPNPSLQLLGGLSKVDTGFGPTWDTNIISLCTRIQVLLGGLGQVLSPLPIRLEVEFLRERAMGPHTASNSSNSITMQQLRQAFMHRVFLSPVQYLGVQDPTLSCCLECDTKLVKKADGISKTTSGYLTVYLGSMYKTQEEGEPGQCQEEAGMKGQKEFAHRLVCWARHGPPPEEGNIDACHKCHNKKCLNPWHLDWKAHPVNVQDSSQKA